MKNVWSLIGKASFLFGFCVFYSCKGKEDNTAILEQINDGLVQSNQILRTNTAEILQAWQNKVDDPKTAERAKLYQPKATAVHVLSSATIDYIDSLKNWRLRQKSGNEIAAELYAKLDQFKKTALAVDEKMSIEMEQHIVLISKEMNSAKDAEKKITQMMSHSSPIEINVLLSRIQNNIIIDEQKMIRYLFDQLVYDAPHYDEFFDAIVAQNAKVLKTGDKLEITAGMGRFIKRSGTTITINGNEISLNENGIAFYKREVSTKAGSYAVPVKFKFTDQDGNIQTRTIAVEYKTVSANLK